jgi:hypothetical protein
MPKHIPLNIKSYKSSGFIGEYQKLIKNTVIPYQYSVLCDKAEDTEKSHVIDNFINAAKADECSHLKTDFKVITAFSVLENDIISSKDDELNLASLNSTSEITSRRNSNQKSFSFGCFNFDFSYFIMRYMKFSAVVALFLEPLPPFNTR